MLLLLLQARLAATSVLACTYSRLCGGVRIIFDTHTIMMIADQASMRPWQRRRSIASSSNGPQAKSAKRCFCTGNIGRSLFCSDNQYCAELFQDRLRTAISNLNGVSVYVQNKIRQNSVMQSSLRCGRSASISVRYFQTTGLMAATAECLTVKKCDTQNQSKFYQDVLQMMAIVRQDAYLFSNQNNGRMHGAGRMDVVKLGLDGTKRSLINEAEFAAALKQQLGFSVVNAAELTEQEKAFVFGIASVVVLPLGAGMTNLIWAAPHARVVMLCPPSMDRQMMVRERKAKCAEFSTIWVQTIELVLPRQAGSVRTREVLG